MKKGLALWMAAWLACGVLAAGLTGCGEGDGGKKEEQLKITFWHWWADQQDTLKRLAAEYEDETGIKVVFELIDGGEYFKKIQASATARTLPDMIGLAGGGDVLARYINAGRILELTEELNRDTFKWRNTFFPRALEAFFYEENNIYKVKPNSYWGLPVSVMNIQLFYHKDLFAQAGLDPEKPPETWSQLVKACEKLNAAGIPPLLAGFADLWIDYTFFNAYCWSYLGAENMKKLYRGELPYTNDGCLKALQRVVDLRVHKMLYEGSISKANKEAEIDFANKKAAIMLNGSWAVNVYQGLNPNLQLGVFPFPKPDDAQHPMYLIGGVGKGCAVTTSSKYPQETVEFMRWFTAKEQQVRLAKEAREIPANFQAMEDIDPLLRGFARGMRSLTPDIKIEEKNEVREVISKGMQSILIGEEIPQNILQKAWEVKQKISKP